jgi:hypothetical protein
LNERIVQKGVPQKLTDTLAVDGDLRNVNESLTLLLSNQFEKYVLNAALRSTFRRQLLKIIKLSRHARTL